MPIYDNIKYFAEQKSISIAKLEKASGVANGTMSKWNTSQPRVLAIRRTAAILDVSIDDLVSNSHPSN